MTEIIVAPLNKLDADPMNVRKTYTSESLEGLAASLLAKGQLQNIVIRKAPKGRFYVTAGGRRRAAFLLLAERGQIAEDFGINAIMKQAEDATEISLAENVMREDMHPADQFIAFKTLFDEGKTVKDIAARFGTTENTVTRRLALARVAPALFEAYRAEKMDFDQLAAFTITDDHARQEEVWASIAGLWDKSADTIKRRLTGDEVPASDKRVTFIGGLDAYELAGGPARRDLFATKDGGFACDPVLLDKLVSEKLEAEAEAVKAEGWNWVEIHMAQPNNYYSMERVYAKTPDLSEDDKAKLAELEAQRDELAAQIEEGPEDEAAEQRFDELKRQIAVIENRDKVYQDEDRALAGVMVMIDYHGKLSVTRGMVRAEDAKRKAQAESGEVTEAEEGEGDQKAATLSHSATLIEDLTAQKTAALRLEMANNSDIALVAVVHALLLSTVYRGRAMGNAQSVLQLNLTNERLEGSLKRPDENKALEGWESLKENFGHMLPADTNDLWDWLMDQQRDQLLNLLAFAAAHSVNAVELKYSGDRKQAFANADQLGQALNVKMGDYFTPTVESYFSHLNRQSIGAAVAEVCGRDFAEGVSGMKKADAAEFAAKSIKGTGWLPPHIRIPPAPTDEAEGAEIHQFPAAAE